MMAKFMGVLGVLLSALVLTACNREGSPDGDVKAAPARDPARAAPLPSDPGAEPLQKRVVGRWACRNFLMEFRPNSEVVVSTKITANFSASGKTADVTRQDTLEGTYSFADGNVVDLHFTKSSGTMVMLNFPLVVDLKGDGFGPELEGRQKVSLSGEELRLVGDSKTSIWKRVK